MLHIQEEMKMNQPNPTTTADAQPSATSEREPAEEALINCRRVILFEVMGFLLPLSCHASCELCLQLPVPRAGGSRAASGSSRAAGREQYMLIGREGPEGALSPHPVQPVPGSCSRRFFSRRYRATAIQPARYCGTGPGHCGPEESGRRARPRSRSGLRPSVLVFPDSHEF